MSTDATERVATDIPARLDRLPWSRWHWTIVTALGVAWALDGLEVTIVGSISGRLTERAALGLSVTDLGVIGSIYLPGAVVGALVFGWLADRLGRKRLFLVTLGWYATFTVLSAFSWNFASLAVFRFLTGNGIGGEYAAINSAIDELIPARRRGWTNLAVGSTGSVGTILGAALSLLLLDERIFPAGIGWRLAFGLGAVIALAVLWIRRSVPESPRWLIWHGRPEEAEGIVSSIEAGIQRSLAGTPLAGISGASVTLAPRMRVPFREVARTMVLTYPSRTALGLTLMTSQTFLYAAFFFSQALVLTRFFHVPSGSVGLYLVPFAAGNLLGAWTLGRLFDTVGRRTMIAATYVLSGVLMVGTAELFAHHDLDATTITLSWSVAFFFASAANGSAYLTAGELFPMEIRARAIAFLYAAGTLLGGGTAPIMFAVLIRTGAPEAVLVGYVVAACLMIAGGLAEIVLGVAAERRSLESVAAPLSSR